MLHLIVAGLQALSPVVAAPPADGTVPEAVRLEIVRSLEALEAEWFRVYETHDLAPLERLIADDFVATLGDGAMRSKREHIEAYRADFEALDRVESNELRVRVHTHELAVVTGSYTASLRGTPGATKYRYTDTWLRRNGTWRCVATHESRIE
ncbi:MAG TPA: nuclear transport factor 2 family protein [Vicinamibacteria bacterium]|nr:nuclear transport factor 2 family protein [Vicinamibacteria bacterium]